MNKVEIAEHFDVSLTTVSNWIRRGCPITPGGKMDPQKVTAWREARQSLVSGGSRPRTEARAMKEKYQALLAKLEFEEKSGKLIPVEAVQEVAYETGHRVREAMQNIPPRIESILAAETDIGRVRAILEREIHAALSDISDEFSSAAQKEKAS